MLAAVVIPFLAGAVILLFLLPAHTGTLFAWRIKAHMSSFVLAAVYAGGVYYFFRVLVDARWHRIVAGLPGSCGFVTIEGLATILHWDKFNHGNPAFWGWTALYWVTPLVIPVLWLRNRGADPGTPEPGDAVVPRGARIAFGAVGTFQVAIAAFLFLFPAAAIRHWGWPLTPLTARTSAGWFALWAGCLLLALERRWSGARVLVETLLIGLVVMSIGIVRAWDELDTGRIATWLFVVGVPAAAAGLAGLHLTMRRRARAIDGD